MQKIIRFNDTTIIVLNNGTSFQRTGLSDEEFNLLMNAESDEDILSIMNPEYKEKVRERTKVIETFNYISKSKYLTREGDCVYWEDISHLSLPKELVFSILEAEEEGDDIRIETYKNFWTLMSLNPDEQCRLNLFWFLNRNGLVISRSGFFVAYRNVDKHKEWTKEDEIYTDCHTRTFKIRIGEMVTMPREQCDDNQDVTCSRGLHLGARTWLKENYYGSQGLVCLCNPAEVVAVPHLDYYGKLRTSAYLPIDKAHYDENGDVIPYDAKDGFECEYVPNVIYEGLMGTEKDGNYRIEIPNIPGIDKTNITNRLLDIARETIASREVY